MMHKKKFLVIKTKTNKKPTKIGKKLTKSDYHMYKLYKTKLHEGTKRR